MKVLLELVPSFLLDRAHRTRLGWGEVETLEQKMFSGDSLICISCITCYTGC